ncbi:MAG: TetR/AcrR family transcriptional regulator [Cyanosarcina radialis HA8281-LM2]|jgi:AcrR family transcriptional regulator|nr:TetR/AcrR family transcriptional regulator [Cyanosarcina radialis HA8281-LM2]
MPRNKTIADEEILAVARSLFLQQGASASTRDIAKQAGISEAVIYQRFGTKEDFFFASMKLPEPQLDSIFAFQPGKESVVSNLQFASRGILDYFREAMPIFLTLISHPAFEMPTFLTQHRLPAARLSERLIDYLMAEAELGRVREDKVAVAASVLLSHLHQMALSECIGASAIPPIDGAIAEAIALLWAGLQP